MIRATRSKVGIVGNDNSTKLKSKIDLSSFKRQPKAKLSNKLNLKTENIENGNDPNNVSDTVNESSKLLKGTKRERIEVEYDDDEDTKRISKIKKDDKAENEVIVIKKRSVPANFEEAFNNIREMCKNLNIEPDTIGKDENLSPEENRYQILVCLMISSQTKDKITDAAMLKLRELGLTIDNIININDEELGKLIYPVAFWKTKVKNLKKTAEILRNEYDYDIPKSSKDLCKLPGVGPKMAHLCMKAAWGEVTGIAVDTHVHRVSNRLGWVNTKTPEQTRALLEDWVPKELWKEADLLLVDFGQNLCPAVKPQCENCLNNKLCPFGRKATRGKGKNIT